MGIDDFKFNIVYKLDNIIYGTYFEGKLSRSKHDHMKNTLIGTDKNGCRCHLPLSVVCDKTRGWELHHGP